MELKAGFAKVVGTPKEGRDSWVFVEDGLFLVLEIGGPPGFSVASFGKEIIASLTLGFKNLSKKNLANFEGLVRGVKLTEGVSLSLILGAQIGKVFYLVCLGGGRAVIRRQGKFGIILEQEGSASGILQDKDIFILSSPRFAEIVSFEEVKSIFDASASLSINPEQSRRVDNFSPTELAEGLTSLVHRAEDTSGAAAAVLQFEETQEGKWEEKTEETENTSLRQDFGGQGGKRKLTMRNQLSTIYNLISSFFRRSTALYLRTPQNEEERKKRTIFWVAAILVILLGVSIILGIGKKERGKKESRFSQIYEVTLHQYEEGKALLGLNNLRAVTLLGEAKTSLGQLRSSFGKGSPEAKKIEELLGQIEQGIEEASQVFKLAPDVFLDLGLVKEGGEGQNLAIYGETILVSDNKNSSLYQITVKSKSSQILAGGGTITGASLVALGENKAYVLTNEGIVEIELKTKNLRLKIKKDSEWGEIKALNFFAGNLYLLDKTKSSIWKYVGGETGFSGKRNYLTDEYDLSNSSSMAIDGSVWLTTEKILKFIQGKQDSFDPPAGGQGLEQPLGTNLLIFTSDETKNLYILDKTNNRVVVLDKTGTYKSQYIWQGIGEVSDLVVSEGERKIFLLSGSKIYTLELKL